MSNIGGVIKSIRDIFRKDPGLSGDAQRIEQLGWMIFLKLFDDKDKEKEILDRKYKSPIPSKFQWRNWAEDDEGMTGDELIDFINNHLFPALKNLKVSADNRLGVIIRNIFDGTNNYMKSGTTFRQAINKLNEIDFNSSKEHHIFNAIYEDILQGLATKKDTGEFYTPRAVTQFIIDMVNPKLGEKIIDPACGTAGFLVCAIEHLRKQVKNVADSKTLQETITGTELKPLPFMLSVVNLITHDIEVPKIENTDAISRELTSIKQKDRVDIIVANPPFGGVVGDGMETNFPLNYRTKESADLFLILFIQLLKDGGRAGIVLPDGSLTGDGVKQRVRQKLLEDCNVHTIVRLPQSVFAPYATVNTNLIFFDKGKSTKAIWYYEHTLPEGAKAYNKTKPIRIEEFDSLKKWWKKRVESEVAWKVSIDSIKENGFNLDIKNPNQKKTIHQPFKNVVDDHRVTEEKLQTTISQLIKELSSLNCKEEASILSTHIGKVIKAEKAIPQLDSLILKLAIRGKISVQDTKRESASKIIEQINQWRADKNLKSKNLPSLKNEEIPFHIPLNWSWVRLGEVFDSTSGGTPDRGNATYWKGDISWLKSGELTDDLITEMSEEKITELGLKNSSAKLFPKGTLLIALYGATAGKLGILTYPSTTNQAICGFFESEFIKTKYLFYYLSAFREKMVEDSWGQAQPNISQTYLKNFPFALPPIEEQSRIIIEIERLFSITKKLRECLVDNQQSTELLLTGLLHQAFEVNEVEAVEN